MNDKRLLERVNNLAGGLVSRGYGIAGWPFTSLETVPQDIIDAVEGRITNTEFEAKYPEKQWYEFVITGISLDGEVTGYSKPIDTCKHDKYINPRCS